jgi:hypothetical protein
MRRKLGAKVKIASPTFHLAHVGFSSPQDLRSAAYRLEMADHAMKCGASPHAVFKALHLDARYIEAVEKAYNAAEPRVPAGNGMTSGEWTSDGAGSSVSPGIVLAGPAAAPLGDLLPAAADSFGEFVAALLSRYGGAAATVFDFLLIPSSNNLNIKGDVPRVLGLSCSWNRDETLLHLSYVGADGETTDFTAQLEDDVFRDRNGNVVARVLPGGNIVVDKDAVFPTVRMTMRPNSARCRASISLAKRAEITKTT